MSAVAAILTLRDAASHEPALEDILRVTSEVTRVSVKELLTRRRTAQYDIARMVFYHAASVLTSHKTEAISSMLRRERSAASYARGVFERTPDKLEPGLSRVLGRFSVQKAAA